MGMITGCPACGTMFKVVPDQLKVSDGWVRCGHCSEIFDASARLQDAEAARAPTPAPVPSPQPWQATAAPAREPAWASPAPAVWPQQPAAPDSDVLPESASDRESRPPDPFTALPASQDAGDYLREVEALRSVTATADPDDEDILVSPAADADLSFVRQARRRAFWRRPWVRAFMLLLFLGLGVLLAAQVGLQQRERLAAQWPQLRPALEMLCELQHCAIGPWRQIDAVVIDSSGFTRLRAETYRLTVVLNNQAPLAVAMPHLELTLTDTQDQALVRRVLAPQELGASSDALAAGAEWNGAATVAVSLPASVGRVAGYRLIAFYP